MHIGTGELIVVLVAALIIFGPWSSRSRPRRAEQFRRQKLSRIKESGL